MSAKSQGKVNPDNPLVDLILGPLKDDELMILGISLMPDCPQTQMLDMLNNLRNKYLEQPSQILIPFWWKESPEKFRKEMNDSLSLLPKSDLTEEKRQLRLLEILLGMWTEFLTG